MQELKRVEEINPSLPALHYLGGRILYSVHEYDRAIEMFRKLFKSDPTYSASTHEELAKVYWQMGRYEEGVEEDLQWWANIEESEFIWFGGTEPIDQFRKSFASVEGELRQAFRESGLRGYLQKVITFLSGKSKYKCWGTWGDNIAVRYALLGETDKAVECLNMYADSLRPSEALLTSRAPAFDGIRSDPKFIAWLKKWGLEK
ncbi:tetratricopeptide repeat protein [Candidatus Acetothermia bacterium]|nr:tetratricopeptide repeat protein [Candidatus Acetothermia bacterium]